MDDNHKDTKDTMSFFNGQIRVIIDDSLSPDTFVIVDDATYERLKRNATIQVTRTLQEQMRKTHEDSA